jgi:hypothetical protein
MVRGRARDGRRRHRPRAVATTLTGLQAQPEPFYDSKVTLSAKTTFDAVTNALMTTTLTERSGAAHGDALSLVDRSIVGTPISISTIDRPVFRPDFSTGI